MLRYMDVITEDGVCSEELAVFRNFPVNMMSQGTDSWLNDPRYDMKFGINPNSGVIQIIDTVPKELIYNVNHSNGIGKVWKRSYELVADIIAKYNPSDILEIGGSSGILERIYYTMNEGSRVYNWYIIDPITYPNVNSNCTFIKGYFPEDMPDNIKVSLIVHSHTLEHMYSPKKFINSVSAILKKNGHMVFSIPNLKKQLENNYTSVLTFEHTVYISEEYVDYLLAESGFEIKAKYEYESHSLIYDVVKSSKQTVFKYSLKGLYGKNKLLFNNWYRYHQVKINRLNQYIIDHNLKDVYFFGAHVTLQFYLAFGLNANNIVGVLDNDLYKQGNRVSGTPWRVQSPHILANLWSPVVILPISPYSEEIKTQTINQVNKNVNFLEICNI